MNTPEEEKNDPVWDLLKESRPVKPSAFFSRNVIREVRRLESEKPANALLACGAWLKRQFIETPAISLATAMAAIALMIALPQFVDHSNPASSGSTVATTETLSSTAESATSDVAVTESEYDPAKEISNLDYLGELMAVTDPSLLDDNALADLLF